MADTTLSPTGLVQIEVGASRDTWGGKYNVMVATINAFYDDVSGAAALKVANGGTGAVTAAGARTALGLVIGTDVQACDADLTAIAALTSAADKMPYATGAGAWAMATATSFGRSLLAAADASAARTLLGLGTMAVQAANAVSITGGSATGLTSVTANDVTELT